MGIVKHKRDIHKLKELEDLNLPNSWIWDKHYISKGFEASISTPVYYSKHVPDLTSNSKEAHLLKKMWDLMDVGELKISTAFLISNVTLGKGLK